MLILLKSKSDDMLCMYRKELESNNCRYFLNFTIINSNVCTSYLCFSAFMQGKYSWRARDIGIDQVGEASLIPALSILAEPCRSRVGTIGFSLTLSCPPFLGNSVPYLRRLLHHPPVASGFFRRGRCIDRRDIPFGSLAPRIADGRNRTRSRSPLK